MSVHCPTCGHTVSVEIHNGLVTDFCAGCERNRQRAGMHLPPLDFTPKNTYEPEAPRTKHRSGPRPKETSVMARLKAKLPRSPECACHYRMLASAPGVNPQYVNDTLHVLRARGIAESVEGKHPHQNRTSLLWYRVEGVK